MKKLWTDEEIEILKREYPKYGWNCPSLLKTHSRESIKSKAKNLHIFSNRRNTGAARIRKNGEKWTEKETEILLKEYPEYGWNCPSLVKKRSKTSIKRRAYKLQILSKRGEQQKEHLWTKDDINILRKEYLQYGKYCPSLLKRHSKESIKTKAKELKIKSFAKNSDYLCFIAKFAFIENDTIYCTATCKICGLKDILTMEQMLEHSKTHEE